MGNTCLVSWMLHCFYCVLIALFCLSLSLPLLNTESSIEYSKLLLSVGDRFLCIENNKDVTIRCALRCTSVNITYILAAWRLTWRIQGQNVDLNSSSLLQNNTTLISNLNVAVDWPKDKVFTCFASLKGGKGSGPTLNKSLRLSGSKPSRIRVQGVRFINRNIYKSVEIYWKQSGHPDDTYSVEYKVDDEDLDIKVQTIGKDKIVCSYRTGNVYLVPNTTGLVCWVSVNKVQHSEYDVEHTVKIITKRGECETEGPARKFRLRSYVYVGGNNDLDEDVIVLIPHQVSMFAIRVAKQQVSLTWKYLSNRTSYENIEIFYHLVYTCPELAVENEMKAEGTELTLHSNVFTVYRPYALCQFCIQARPTYSTDFSEPLCRVARLHEERPSEPPRITCDADCATSTDRFFRNVTVTWSLPARKVWNGVLTNVTMSYRRADNISRAEFKVVEQNVSQGFTTLSKLERNVSYVVQTALCNREGCSEFGSPATLAVSMEQNEPKDGATSSDHAAITTVFIVILVAFSVIVVAFLIGLFCQRKKNANTQEGPPDLEEPEEPADYVNISGDQTTEREYDVLSDQVLIEPGEGNEGVRIPDDPHA